MILSEIQSEVVPEVGAEKTQDLPLTGRSWVLELVWAAEVSSSGNGFVGTPNPKGER